MKKSLCIGAAAAALCLVSTAAVAAPTLPLADFTIPTGDIVTGVGQILIPVAVAGFISVASWASYKFFGVKLDKNFNDYANTILPDVLQAGWNRLQAGTPDKTIVPMANDWISHSAQFLIETEGPAFIKWMGGRLGIEKWLEGKIAYLSAEQVAAGATVQPGSPVPTAAVPQT